MKRTKNWSLPLSICLVLLFFSITSVSFCSCGNSNKEIPTSKKSSVSNSDIIGAKASITEDDPTSNALSSEYLPILQELVEMDDKPILIDLGSTSCVPCIEMKPILEDFQKNYADDFHTIFIDVHENPDLSREFGVQFIPTQIFFDNEGNEKYRHVGFFSKEEMLSVLAMNGCDVRDK
ncbi:MAG: thioredoxin family protein [Caldisericia bacterium]|nr:thioredoxin family protein [Caldisericia bacterium]MDD4614876.1 thioredoxin family protein [Caldisericia bacterium]